MSKLSAHFSNKIKRLRMQLRLANEKGAITEAIRLKEELAQALLNHTSIKKTF